MKQQNAAVVGHPVGHTMSPFLQERLFALQGIPMRYETLDAPDLSAVLPRLREMDCFNVTIPHKTGIIPFLDELDDKARLCGSVNTVRVRDGKLSATTTDGAGCFKALRTHGLDFSGRVLLLGTGGAARAIAFEIARRQRDFSLAVVCREKSIPKARALCEELAAFARRRGDRRFRVVEETYGELAPNGGARFDLLINATSVGMTPNAGTSPVPESVVSRCEAVFDAVYNPGETELLRLAKRQKKKTVGGMEMLVYQAVAAHEFWYGSVFREEDVAALVRDAEAELLKRFPESGGKA